MGRCISLTLVTLPLCGSNLYDDSTDRHVFVQSLFRSDEARFSVHIIDYASARSSCRGPVPI